MCSYLHGPRQGGMFYFRMAVPEHLRPVIGKREFFFSLKTKDRTEAKRRILQIEAPRHIALLDAAETELARQQDAPAPSPAPHDPYAHMTREDWEHFQQSMEHDAADNAEHDALVDEADALEERLEAPGAILSPAEQAARFLIKHHKERADRYKFAGLRRAPRPTEAEIAQALAGISKEPAPTATSGPKPVSLTGLFELYGAQDGIAPGTVKQWRTYIKHLVASLGHDDAARVTAPDLIRWREGLRKEKTKAGKPLSAKTINGSYLAAANVTFAYGLNQLLLTENPMASVQSVRADNNPKLRERDFTKGECQAILSAALIPAGGKLSPERALARRWIPWLCAYSGARVNELTQLRAEDVKEVEGVWTIRVTPEAGSIKTNEARTIPLHAHLIEQGFLTAVKGKSGPLFYNPDNARGGEDGRHHKKVGMFLADWVRNGVGITDKGVAPNHGWRHTFKTICREAEIEESASDAISGHAHKGQGRKYGSNTIPALASQLAKFPRYNLGQPAD